MITSGTTRIMVGTDDYMPTHAAPREFPCLRCGYRAPEGAVVWLSGYGDVLCESCVHLAAAGVPVLEPLPAPVQRACYLTELANAGGAR